ncbi:DUF397 domain-containing protein [Streptomyces sp. CBMA156]|uniref:DUF397 domain-containing protein n=1 Tax=Streptomyces sp. CBMA156 TaxID=1930280 RepID=UPI0016619D9A|nr:DUF397 domain-containing protein [Streptomyces sp. CBMA156]MBD0672187.1 DUF397 domain-containing protein [Streptomyces sp. CBMA156]
MMRNEFDVAGWRKSSYSGPDGGDCVEVAAGVVDSVPVRDSKDPDGPMLVFPVAAGGSFIAAVREDEFRHTS